MSRSLGLVRAAAAGLALAALLYAVPVPAGGSDRGGPSASAQTRDLVPLIGSQGIDTALPSTESEVTVSGRGRFADMQVTVNQTESLVNQSVSITWTGAPPTETGPGRFGRNYLQIMQCWGDAVDTVPENPGPPPENCQFGASMGQFAPPQGLLSNPRAGLREVWSTLLGDFEPEADYLNAAVLEESTGVYHIPFQAVDGTTVSVSRNPDYRATDPGSTYWTNPYYDQTTTNEVFAGRTVANGTGAQFFEVQTGLQAPGLGCGQLVERAASGELKRPQCWIVVVPRGEPVDENFGSGTTPDAANRSGVTSSPFNPNTWPNRIAIPVDFSPLELPCDINVEGRRIAGAEVGVSAVTRWQPVLCGDLGLPPFTYSQLPEQSARRQLLLGGSTAPGMISVIEPFEPDAFEPDNPVVYAPLSLSGITIGFNVERTPDVTSPVAQEAEGIRGVRVKDINLTPRLVAKLLTQSYLTAVAALNKPPTGDAYSWLDANPRNLFEDPDFVRFNPEFELLVAGNGRTVSSLTVQGAASDTATVLWEWILADDEAAAWLAGEPDEYGMSVNPLFTTTAADHPSGIPFGAQIPNTFPRPEPYCALPAPNRSGVVGQQRCGLDWLPYVSTQADAAISVSRASPGARIIVNDDATRAIDFWNREGRQSIGAVSMAAVTNTPAASQFGLQMANLSRADDNGDDREFIAPNEAGLTRGVDAMAPRAVASVLQPDHEQQVDGAYPLTVLTYAAVAPRQLDEAGRVDYAQFLTYAGRDGQVRGLEPGKLPPGYASLPDELAFQTRRAASFVREPQDAPPAPTTTTTTPPTETTTATTVSPNTATTSPPATGTVTPNTVSSSNTVFTPTRTPTPTGTGSGSGTPTTGTAGTTSDQSDSSGTTTTVLDDETVAESDDTGTDDTGTDETEGDVTAPGTTVPPNEVAIPGEATERPPTPEVGVGASRMAIPTAAGLALMAALAALEITKRPRRARGVGSTGGAGAT